MEDTEDAWWEDEQFLNDVYRGTDEAVASCNPRLTPAPAQYPAAAAAAASCPPASSTTTSASSLSHVPTARHASATSVFPTSTDSTHRSKPSTEAMVAELQCYERYSAELFSRLLTCTHNDLRDRPVSAAARLSALPAEDDVDRFSRLPDVLLCKIVSRLPVKDAVRTSALSHCWRGIWRSAPLVVADNDLLPVAGSALLRHEILAAVSQVLAAHEGPFRCIHLTTIHMQEIKGQLITWLRLLAVKGTQELVLANRPSPLGQLRLPDAVFSISTLTRLYLAFLEFPNMGGLPYTASFPKLRELGLCTVVLESCHMDFILARSPVLEILYLQDNLLMDRLTLTSHSLRCVHVIASSDLEIRVLETLHLERLIVWVSSASKGGSRKIVEIENAPALTLLGCLEPEFHILRISGKTIKKWTKDSEVPTVRILGLKVRFGVHEEAELLSSFLRCFPNVERLHIVSKKTAESTSKLTLKSWEKHGEIQCIRSKVKLMIFQNFRGAECELCFLKFLLESARTLSKLVILYDKENFTSPTEVESMVEPLFESIWASNGCSLRLIESTPPKTP